MVVIDAADSGLGKVCSVSDLRSRPFVVLLGEPGSGKSSTLQAEARGVGSQVVTARELIYGVVPDHSVTLYVDALDEFRSDGAATDKTWNLAAAMANTKASRWWVACRSEDWRSDADVKPFLHLTSGARPVVAQLQALRHQEVIQVLTYLGEDDPEKFVEKAYSLGANAFLQGPLSIRLLHRAVNRDGTWPSSRLALFDSATRALAAEGNQDYESGTRMSQDDIVAAAGRISLILLASGASSIWRSNAEKPGSGIDVSQYVDVDDLRMEPVALSDVLDSSLFKGEGRSFEPVHRTIAEFLAARTLARAIVGSSTAAAFPLSRAVALVCSPDGAPPTELRGLYAWLAAHLATLGDHAGATRLIESDAVSVLTYGDASAFSADAKRNILRSLDRSDPYFRASRDWWGGEVVAFGGLACEELSSDFAAVLEGADDDTHLLETVFEVLTAGQPVNSLRPLLRRILLDPSRQGWHRVRAVRAYLNGEDNDEARSDLLTALESEPVTIDREVLRMEIMVGLSATRLDAPLVKSVLASFEGCPDSATVGQLYNLQRRLEEFPPMGLFNEPAANWRQRGEGRGQSREVDDFLDHVLAATIKQTAAVRAAELWTWMRNVSSDVWSGIGSETSAALTKWLQEDPARSGELFDAILRDDDPTNGPWVAPSVFMHVTRRPVPAEVVEQVVERARSAHDEHVGRRLLAAAVEIVRQGTLPTGTYWQVYNAVAARPGGAALLTRLTYNDLDVNRAEASRRELEFRAKDEKTASENVANLMPWLTEIRTAQRPAALGWGADQYFATSSHPAKHGIDRLIYYSDSVVTEAITEGWRFVVANGLGDISASDLGAFDAQNRHYYVETAAVAGVDLLLEQGEFPDASTEVAIAVLRHSYFARDEKRRKALENWARHTLADHPEAASQRFREYWSAALEHGATHLGLLSQLTRADDRVDVPAVPVAVEQILESRHAMGASPLKQLLQVAAEQSPRERITEIAESALRDPSLTDESRRIWRYVVFNFNPVVCGAEFITEHADDELVDLFESYLGGGLAGAFDRMENPQRIAREAMTIRLLGRHASPSEEHDHNTTTGRAVQLVRGALNRLSTTADPQAVAALEQLLRDGSLAPWHQLVRHSIATFNRLERDRTFRHPAPQSIREALEGGPPVNGADLMAVILEELRRLASEFRTDDVSPWKRYWNIDARGRPTVPLVENECRDRLLERLRDRLKPYGIFPPLPEARRAEETRADVLAFSAKGHTVPIEAKRNNHPEIWNAASTQLQGYANAAGADGHGVYLVFWFGNSPHKTPSRPDGQEGPKTAAEMENMLTQQMPPDIAPKTVVVVLDVSNPASEGALPARKRRSREDEPCGRYPKRQ
ncbi:hypothetical protein [Paraburkholderia azotifigens]|uniref:ATP-binding protein n=1 Tax=Paraburkholderia azotifigens TaxID=2057004 RepID=A0ABU9R468_9BURK